MVNNNISLHDLSLAYIMQLLEKRIPEGPRLDYKENAYSGREADIREMLRDVGALANAGGGYLIMGIREDGFGRPSELTPVENYIKKSQSIRQACLDGIQERIDGLEVVGFEVESNKGIIVIRVPESEKKPHMVSMDHRSDFYRRYDTDKRVMSIGEIRDCFVESPYFRRLLDIQEEIQKSQNTAEGQTYLKIITDRPVERFFERYISNSNQQVLSIISPFIGDTEGQGFSLADLIKKTQTDRTNVFVITRNPKETYHKDALAILLKAYNFEIRYNEELHAKLYISWNIDEAESFAMFGSGNLTNASIQYNLELGMIIRSRGNGRRLVRELYRWGDYVRTRSQKIKGITRRPE